MEYIVVAGKYLTDDDTFNFSERVEDYIRQGKYKFEEHLAQDQPAIDLFRKYISALIGVLPSNVYAYTSKDEWIVIFSQKDLETEFENVKGKLYMRMREVENFLEILSIKETTDSFYIDSSIIQLPEKYSYPQTVQFDRWNFIAMNWQNTYLKKTQPIFYKTITGMIPAARIINAKIPTLTEDALKENLSAFKMPLVFYFNKEVSGTEFAAFINSAPSNLINIQFLEKISYFENTEYPAPGNNTATQIKVVIQYKPECLILP